MAANPRDEAVLSSWLRPHSRARTHSCSTRNLGLVSEGFLGGRCAPLSRRLAIERFGDCRDMLWRISAATAGNVDQSPPRKVAQISGHVLRPQVEPGFRQRI